MKITSLAQGTGVPAQSDSSLGRTADPGKMARAKAIASGQEAPQDRQEDRQIERAQESIRRIKMKTNVSTNRDDLPEDPGVEIQNPTSDVIEPTEQAPEETRSIDPQIAALMKAKRALQVKERELEQREEAVRSQVPANQEDFISKADLLANPLKIFEAGLTYDQLTEAILNNQSQPVDQQKLRQEIKEDLLKELNGQLSSRDQQAEAQVLGEIKREAIELTAQGEQFEAIREAKAQNQIPRLIHRIYKEGWPEKGIEPGYVMNVADAAELIENQLIDDVIPMSNLKKVQSRLTPQQEVVAQTPIPQRPNTKTMRTLTNRDSASPSMDRRARAIAAMQGTLKRG